MAPAQQCQVVEVSGAAGLPGVEVVGVARIGRQRVVKLWLGGPHGRQVLQERWAPGPGGWRVVVVELASALP